MGKRKGFTLLELIVVMAIIGVLSAIAVPNYIKYVQKANNAKIEADGKLIEEAVLIAMLELQKSGQDTGTASEIVSRIEKHVKETLPSIKNITFGALYSSNDSYFDDRWYVTFSPKNKNSMEFSSINEIFEIKVNGGMKWKYTGEIIGDSRYYHKIFMLKLRQYN